MNNTQNLQGKTVAMLATNGFEQIELLKPKEMLIAQGAIVEVISIDDQNEITGWDEDNWGKK
jgi:protease I